MASGCQLRQGAGPPRRRYGGVIDVQSPIAQLGCGNELRERPASAPMASFVAGAISERCAATPPFQNWLARLSAVPIAVTTLRADNGDRRDRSASACAICQ